MKGRQSNLRDSLSSEPDTQQLKAEEDAYVQITDELMEATSFHQSVPDLEKHSIDHEYFLFEFKKLDYWLGGWALFGLLVLAAVMTVGNAFAVQILQEKFVMNAGEILFFRSTSVVLILAVVTRNSGLLRLDLGESKDIVLIGSLTLSIGNIAFILCLANISIAAAFSLIVMINPLAVLVSKNWRFSYYKSELFVLLVCVLGVAVLGYPWGKTQILGVSLGLITLFLTYFYDALRNGFQKQVPLITTVFLSNLIIAVISIPMLFVLKPKLPTLETGGLVLLTTICYLLGLELVHRVNTLLHDEFVHILFYLYVLFGFMVDYFASLKQTNIFDLIGSALLLTASYYGKNLQILKKFYNVVRHGSPLAPPGFDAN